MEQVKETSVKEQLVNRLVAAVEELPTEKVYAVLDFAGYLQSQYSQRRPERGTAEAMLEALERVGPLIFAPGELDEILADIERSRDMDLKEHG